MSEPIALPGPLDWDLATDLFELGYHICVYSIPPAPADVATVAATLRGLFRATLPRLEEVCAETAATLDLQSLEKKFVEMEAHRKYCGEHHPDSLREWAMVRCHPNSQIENWTLAGLATFAWEEQRLQGLAESDDVVELFRKAFLDASMSSSDIRQSMAAADDVRPRGLGVLKAIIRGWLDQQPRRSEHELLLDRLAAQHTQDDFPEHELLRRLDATPALIAFLRLVYAHRPEPLSISAGARAVTDQGIEVERTTLGKSLRKCADLTALLLQNRGQREGYAWRSPVR